MLRFSPISGVNEIGRNCYLYYDKTTGEAVLVDFGSRMSDPTTGSPYESHIPDLKILRQLKLKLKMVIITHCHEDHIGGFRYLKPLLEDVPRESYEGLKIVANEYNIKVLKKKHGNQHFPCEIVPEDEFVHISKDFAFMLLRVNHSVPCCNGILFRQGGVHVFHSGDLKEEKDPLLEENYLPALPGKIQKATKGAPISLVLESTNAFSPKSLVSLTEKESQKRLAALLKGDQCRNKCVFLTCFASSVHMVVSAIRSSMEAGRRTVLQSPSIKTFTELSAAFLSPEEKANIISPDQAQKHERSKLLYMVSGSQGEGSSFLAKIAGNSAKDVKISSDSVVIFASREIPGNEVAIQRLRDKIYRAGARILKEANIHVTGHAYSSNLMNIVKLLKPLSVATIHGNLFQMAEMVYSIREEVPGGDKMKLIVSNNGTVIDFNSEGAKVVENITVILNALAQGKIIAETGTADSPQNRRIALQRRLILKEGMYLICVCLATARVLFVKAVACIHVSEEHNRAIKNNIDNLLKQELRPDKEEVDQKTKENIRQKVIEKAKQVLRFSPFVEAILIGKNGRTM